MNKMYRLDDYLHDLGIKSRAELARRLGLTPTTVSRWGNNPPQYAIAWLESEIRFQTLVRAIKDLGRDI